MDAHPQLVAARKAIVTHPLLERLQTAQAWRIFMAHHVFAVWDFMSLAKRLQRELTCTQLPWLPPTNPSFARFINEIVLAEESDDDGQGGFQSHFDFYRQAMRHAGASVTSIDGFVEALRLEQTDVKAALAAFAPGEAVQSFVSYTLSIAEHAPVHVVASVFFYGREDVIPDMFESLSARVLAEAPGLKHLQTYLKRHIDLDGDSHGPLAAQMLDALCQNEPLREQQAQDAAIEALGHRQRLWTAIARAIDAPEGAAASLG